MTIIKVLRRMFICIRTWIDCVRIGWNFDKTWNIGGGDFGKKDAKVCCFDTSYYSRSY